MTHLAFPGTFSKSPLLWGLPEDLHILWGWGAQVLLSDSTTCIDWTSSLGQSLFGYDKELNDYVIRQVKYGNGFTLPHKLEYEVAERLATLLGEHVPGWNIEDTAVRFGKSGTDVTTAAVRIARAVTGRDFVITFRGHYHGWADWSISRTPPAWGIPNPSFGYEIAEYEWGNPTFAKINGKNVAAVIFEHPVGEPPAGWPQLLRKWCDDNGALLIADEVVTGLRYGLGGICEKYGYDPDLVCMGKALGNGYAVSALAGRRELMNWFSRVDPVFWSSTANGNAVDLTAANYVLSHWDGGKVKQLCDTGQAMARALALAGWSVGSGDSPRFVVSFADEYEATFFTQEMYRLGHLCNRPYLPNLAMTKEDVANFGEAAQRVRLKIGELGPEGLKREVKQLRRRLFSNR